MDVRFKNIKNDAKFRRIPRKEQKVKVDKRFQSMFKDEKFKEEFSTDKRGRPVKHSSSRDLKRYYHLTSSEESSETEEESQSEIDVSTNIDSEDRKAKSTIKKNDIAGISIDQERKRQPVEEPKKKVSTNVTKRLKNLKVDYARGEQNLFSESSSDDDEEESERTPEEIQENIEHKWGELGTEAETTEDITHRLAACNMDWDRIRAKDIMVLLHSFLPTGGTIENVKIYLSEFGKKRLEEEDISGPTELREIKSDEVNEENEEGSKYHMEKLRQYQLNRLKYYYAIITFSDAETANKVYLECDGLEYESSSTKIDLRFVPDDMEFDEATEVCDELPDMERYQPRYFVTTALQQSKVNLTWDETNPDRIEFTQKLNKGKLDDIKVEELQNYIALSDDEDNLEQDVNLEETEVPVEKYKALLQSIEEEEREKQIKDIQMEVTWGVELEKKTEELIKKKMSEKEEKTPFQQYLEKRKEKRKEKKKLRKENEKNSSEESDSDLPSDIDLNDAYFAEEFSQSEFPKKSKKKRNEKKEKRCDEDEHKQADLELLLMNNELVEKNHFSLEKIQRNNETGKKIKKNKKKAQKTNEESEIDCFKVNVSDPRFSAIFSSHHYNIDPSDPHYKKTEGMEQLILEKLKRRINEDTNSESKKFKSNNERKNAELKLLVKSVKRKAEALNKIK